MNRESEAVPLRKGARGVNETSLEMEDRHIVQFEGLITKQEMLLARLEQNGRTEIVEQAREILANMRALLHLAWEYRNYLLQRKLGGASV
jgi:hypothetical protein